MKIYTITFQYTRNCGAALQTYALYKYLQSENTNQVEVIDYRPLDIPSANGIINEFMSSPSLKALLLMPLHLMVERRFREFDKQNIKLTKICRNTSDLMKITDADLFVAGSDQIWNKDITNGLNDGYFLNFNHKAKKISYAASVGADLRTENEWINIIEKVKNLDKISVREKNAYLKLKDMGKKNTKHVLDPIFLLDKDNYQKIAKKPKFQNYVLIYEMGSSKFSAELARMVANKYNLKVVQLKQVMKRKGVDYIVPGVSPDEFLGFFLNASFIITTSFHGTAFSVHFRKPFYSLRVGNRTSRLESLLYNIGLEDRLLSDISNLNISEPDFERIEKNIDSWCEESKKFIDDVIIDISSSRKVNLSD